MEAEAGIRGVVITHILYRLWIFVDKLNLLLEDRRTARPVGILLR